MPRVNRRRRYRRDKATKKRELREHQQWENAAWDGDYVDYEQDWEAEWDDTPVDSCDECGVNIYEDEDTGSGLCPICEWMAEQCSGSDDSGFRSVS